MTQNTLAKDTLVNRVGFFLAVPHSVVKLLPAIGVDAYVLWSYLYFRTHSELGIAWPSYETIVADTTLTRKRVSASIEMLEEHDLLERRKRFGNSTEYIVLAPAIDQSCTPGTTGEITRTNRPVVQGGHDSRVPVTLSVVPQGHAIKNDVTKNESLDLKDSAADLPTDAQKEGFLASLRAKALSRQETEEVVEEPVPRPPAKNHRGLFGAIVKVCAVDLSLPGKKAEVGKLASYFLSADQPYTPEEVFEWRKRDWRKQPPTLYQLKAELPSVRQPLKGQNGAVVSETPAEAAARRFMETEGITEEVAALQASGKKPKRGAALRITDGK